MTNPERLPVLRRLSVLLAACLLASLLPACGGGEAPSPDGKGNTQSQNTPGGKAETKKAEGGTAVKVSAPGEFPIVEQPATLSAMALVPPATLYTNDIANNAFTKYYQEKTNVTIDWEFVIGDANEMTQKFQLRLMGDDLPDMFLCNPMDRTLLLNCAKEGVVLPLNDLIDKQTVWLKELFVQRPEQRTQLIAPDGNIYGLGYITEYYHGTASFKLWVYKPWLDQLNLSMPQTTEEFYTMLKAFKDNNLGLPMLVNNQSFFATIFTNPFIYYDLMTGNTMLDGDKVAFVPDKEEYREALRYMKRLYVDELVPKDMFTMDANQKAALMNDPKQAFGVMDNFAPYASYTNLTMDSNCFDFVVVPPLEGPKGKRQTPLRVFTTTPNRFSITKACESPELAMRWVDWLFSLEGLGWSNYGPEQQPGDRTKQGWYRPKEGEVDILGNPAKFGTVQLPPDDPNFVPNSAWDLQVAPWFFPLEMHTGMVADPTSPFTKGEAQIYHATEEMEPYKQSLSVPDFFMSEEGAARINTLVSPINELTAQAQAEFITGVRDIDKDWDAYLAELQSLGLQEYLDLLNQEYATFLSNK